MKKIGILGGISYTSTLRYYEYLHELHYQHKGDYYYPEMVIESMNFQYFTDLENEGPQENYESYILKGLQDLQAAGSDFLIMAANSPHSVLADIRPHLAVPVLSIVDAVGRKAQSMGLKKLVLTGIRHTQRPHYLCPESFFPIAQTYPRSQYFRLVSLIQWHKFVHIGHGELFVWWTGPARRV
jgi:aspartate racemase